jgi:hypothetical protein
VKFQFKAKGLILTAAPAGLRPKSENDQQNQTREDAKQAKKPELTILVPKNLIHHPAPTPGRDQRQQAFDDQHPAKPLQQVFELHGGVTFRPSCACP